MACLVGTDANAKKSSHGDGGKFFELKTFKYQPRAQTAIEPEFSTPSRIAHDTEQSLKLARALDVEFGLADRADCIDSLLHETEVRLRKG